jgi:type II secretory pathway pseudopilin PulG
MTPSASIRSKARPAAIRDSEQGYVLLIAIFFMALLVLALAVAAPKIAKSIQRDRDLETWHRGMQFRRAVQLYYRKFHAYPPNVDALVNTNNIRYLRKRYKDPITGQDDWKPIMFGQNKTPTAMGFFGQPLAGSASTLAGIGPSGGAGLPGATNPGSSFSSGGFSLGSPSFGSSATQSPSSSTTGPSDIFGSSSGTTAGTDNSGATGATGSASSGTTPTGISGDATSANLASQTFGGAGIIGFSPASPKQSILVYKKKNHYNEWEFTYDPLSDMQTMGGGNTGMIGQPASNTTNPVGTTGLGGLNSPNSGLGGPSSPNSGLGGSGSSSNPTPAPMPPETPAPQ